MEKLMEKTNELHREGQFFTGINFESLPVIIYY